MVQYYTVHYSSVQYFTVHCYSGQYYAVQYTVQSYKVQHWYNVWKSRGCIMVNGVPMEVPRPKSKGPQAPRVFGRGTSRGTPFTMIHPRLFQTFSFFRHPGLVKRDFFFQWCPRDTIGKWRGHEAPPLVELNPNMLVRDVERMYSGILYSKILHSAILLLAILYSGTNIQFSTVMPH